MKYFDEMDNKYGFGDGTAIPPDAEVCRFVYITVINKLLEKFGSSCRIRPFDRCGLHNTIMWVCVPAGTSMADWHGSETMQDAAWDKAIEVAMAMDLDDCVDIKASVNVECLGDKLVAADQFKE